MISAKSATMHEASQFNEIVSQSYQFPVVEQAGAQGSLCTSSNHKYPANKLILTSFHYADKHVTTRELIKEIKHHFKL
jgi:hypothetical protein